MTSGERVRAFRQWTVGAVISAEFGLACGQGTLPPPPAKHPSPPRVSVMRSDALYRSVQQIAPAADPLSALPSELRERLSVRLQSLGEDAKQELLSRNQPAAMSHPLLYLAAGGQDVAVYELLYATAAGSDELLQLQLPQTDFQPLISVANQLAALSAQRVLRELAHDLAPGRERKQELLREVIWAAQALGRSDIELCARQELALKHPAAEHDLALAQLHAQRLELGQAQQLLARIPKDDANRQYNRTQTLVEAAALALAPDQSEPPPSRAQRARAFLTLGRPDLALKLLTPALQASETDLRIATAYARAATGGNACPLVEQRIATPALCAAGWSQALKQLDVERLKRAWLSGQGRDAVAVEEYLGLIHVVPMTYGLGVLGAGGIPSALRALQADAREAVSVAPYFEAMAVLAESLLIAVSSPQAPSAKHLSFSPSQRARLLENVTALRANLRDDSWGQAAELGTLAILMQDENIGEQLQQIEPHVRREHAATLATLRLWQMLAENDGVAFEQSKALWANIAQNEQSSSLQRSRWLLLWAEAAVQLSPGLKSNTTLLSMAQRLAATAAPLSLRLRSALDRAGLRARAGEFSAAAEILSPIVESTPRSAVANRLEQELLIAASGYLMVLRALSAEGSAREDLGNELEAFLLDIADKRAAPPTLQLWLAIWRGEIAYLVARDACRGSAPCERRAARIRGIPRETLTETVGVRSAQLLSNGVLPVGGLEIKFQYQPDGRLSPKVALDTRFLIIHSPESVSSPPR